MSEDSLRQAADLDRNFWHAHARRSLKEAFKILEDGRIQFGDWERLFLSAAIDHFRDRNFEQSSVSARRIFNEHQRPLFTGHFTQAISLADLRAEYDGLKRGKPRRSSPLC
jgi:hypothetical protein